jgi:hypothetical protein
VGAANALHQHATKYCGQLQDYNGKLQAELQTLSEQLRLAQALLLLPLLCLCHVTFGHVLVSWPSACWRGCHCMAYVH